VATRIRHPWKQSVTCRDREHPPAPGMKPLALAGIVVCALALAACDQPGDEAATAEGTASAAPDQLPKPDGPVTYDPASCPQDADGMVYVTLYGMVFKFPHEDPLMFGAVPPNELNRVPQPSNPDAPEGCPGHPLRASSISLTYHYADVKADPAAPRAGRLDQFRLFGVGDMYWGNQISYAEGAVAACREFGASQFTDILTECRPPERRTGWYIADPAQYVAPYGQLFAVVCLPASSRSDKCSVAYKIHRKVNLQYSFQDRNIQVSSIVEVDGEIRERIRKAYAPELSKTLIGPPERLLERLELPRINRSLLSRKDNESKDAE